MKNSITRSPKTFILTATMSLVVYALSYVPYHNNRSYITAYSSATVDIPTNINKFRIERIKNVRDFAPLAHIQSKNVSHERPIHEPLTVIRPVRFNFSSDILTFVHIQRTGGTQFDKVLTHRIQALPPCKCLRLVKVYGNWRAGRVGKGKVQCQCPRPISDSRANQGQNDELPAKNFSESLPPDGTWLFTRATHNWKYCGMHATYPQLRTCIPLVIKMEELLNLNIMDVSDKSYRVDDKMCENHFSNLFPHRKNVCEFINRTGVILQGNKIVGIQNVTFGFDAREPDKKRNYYFITNLRDPITRYMSEYKMVKAGATWNSAIYPCNGELNHIPKCFTTENWKNVTLKEFMNCPQNIANNRMTRHLADVENIGCYNNALNLTISDYNNRLLQSAKRNLQYSFQSFGLHEYPTESVIMHARMLHLTLTPKIDEDDHSLLRDYKQNLSSEVLERITEINDLDIKLYKFGVRLFFERYRKYVQVQ